MPLDQRDELPARHIQPAAVVDDRYVGIGDDVGCLPRQAAEHVFLALPAALRQPLRQHGGSAVITATAIVPNA